MLAPEAIPLLDEYTAAVRAELDALAARRAALDAQVRLLRDLQQMGVAATVVAVRFAKATGEGLSTRERKRLAKRISKRAERATSGRKELGAHPALDGTSPIRSGQTPQRRGAEPMSLIKKTTTTTHVCWERAPTGDHDEDLDGLADAEVEEEEMEDEEEPTPSASKPGAKPRARR